MSTRRALITGGSGAIGAAICRRLAADGCHVIIHANGGLDRAQALCASLLEQGHSAETVCFDVTDAEAPRFAFRPLGDHGLIEVPVTTVEAFGRRMAAGGGGFFRVLPYDFSRWAIRQVNTVDGRPAIFYFHPWEIDPDQPRVAGAPLRSRLRHYTGLGAMAGKLARLARDFAWDRMDRVVAEELRRMPLPELARAA